MIKACILRIDADISTFSRSITKVPSPRELSSRLFIPSQVQKLVGMQGTARLHGGML